MPPAEFASCRHRRPPAGSTVLELLITAALPRLPLASLAVAATLSLAACASGTGSTTAAGGPGDAPIKVATSTDVYGAVVKVIGADRVSVTSFIDRPGADPEAYESTPADAVAIAAARLVVGNGEGYDDFVFRLVEAAGGQRTVLNVSELSGLKAEVAQGEQFNEHIWFNLAAMQRLGDRIAVELGTIRPAEADTFTANARTFSAQVEDLRNTVKTIAADFPGARVAATEPLPLYLVADARLENATPEQFMEANEGGTDAPAAVVQEALELVGGADPVRALLLNTQTQTPATDRLRQAAKAAGIPEVAVNETLSDGFTDYVPWIGAQIDALAGALAQKS